MNAFGSKSQEKIMVALSSSASITQDQLISITGLSERSVKYALKDLGSNNFISEQMDFSDMRRKSYKLRGGNQ